MEVPDRKRSQKSLDSETAFIKAVEAAGYELPDNYTWPGSNGHIILICPSGHKWTTTSYHFNNRGQRCRDCPRNISIIVKNRFLQQLESAGYTLLGTYVNNSTNVSALCPKRHIIEVRPSSFNVKPACAKCYGNCPIQAGEEFLESAKNEGYTIIDKYVNGTTKLRAICPEEHIIEILPRCFNEGHRCIPCQGLCPIQAERQFMSLIEEEKYTLRSIYTNSTTKVSLTCIKEHDWRIEPCYFKAGTRCPNCPRIESKGEKSTRLVLDKLGLNYTREVSFSFLPTRKYDFCFGYNGNNFIIEYDGDQHFKYSSLFHGSVDEFDRRKHADIIKTYYAINNNCKIIRISYKEKNNIEGHIIYAISMIQTHNLTHYFSNGELYKYITDPLILT